MTCQRTAVDTLLGSELTREYIDDSERNGTCHCEPKKEATVDGDSKVVQ